MWGLYADYKMVNTIGGGYQMNRQKCIDMWQWIVDHPGNDKDDWCNEFPELAVEVDHHISCFACKEEVENGNRGCHNCPVNWGNNGGCMSYGSPYSDWDIGHRLEDAKRVLDIIIRTWEKPKNE